MSILHIASLYLLQMEGSPISIGMRPNLPFLHRILGLNDYSNTLCIIQSERKSLAKRHNASFMAFK